MHPVYQPDELCLSGGALRVMFEARKRVFVDRLKWNVPVIDGRFEIDQFDTQDAEYLILTDDAGAHRASARLLRTDGPHILGDLFPQLCASMPPPSGPGIAEITRFCIEPDLPRGERRAARNQLVTALVRYALGAGISDYVAVASKVWFEQIAAFGWNCEALGPCLVISGESLVALRIGIDAGTGQALAENGIFESSDYRLANAPRMH